jgi:predicted lipoprotein with Yx(FWY)xxD motif
MHHRVVLLLLLTIALTVATAAVAAPPRATVGTRTTSLGKVLVDAKGRTLYVFDLGACTGSCASAWPPLLTTGTPAGVHGLGTKRLSNGTQQVTFAGKPLYRYALDVKPGQVAGAAVAHWFALSPKGAKLHAKPAPTTTTTPGGGYYGGGDGY